MNNNIKKAKQYIDCFNKEKPNITYTCVGPTGPTGPAGPAGASWRQPQLFFHGCQGEDRPVVRGIPDEPAHGKGQGISARDGPLHL